MIDRPDGCLGAPLEVGGGCSGASRAVAAVDWARHEAVLGQRLGLIAPVDPTFALLPGGQHYVGRSPQTCRYAAQATTVERRSQQPTSSSFTPGDPVLAGRLGGKTRWWLPDRNMRTDDPIRFFRRGVTFTRPCCSALLSFPPSRGPFRLVSHTALIDAQMRAICHPMDAADWSEQDGRPKNWSVEFHTWWALASLLWFYAARSFA